MLADYQKYLASISKTVDEPFVDFEARQEEAHYVADDPQALGCVFGINTAGDWGVVSVIDFETGQEFDVA